MILKPLHVSVSNTAGMLRPIANAVIPTFSNGLEIPDAYFRDLKASDALRLRVRT